MKEKIYLAGGMNSGWQEELIEELRNRFVFFNPRNHELLQPSLYTTWDLHFVKKADIIFAYMEKDHPSGYGLTLEIGYAKALNKTIILVDNKSTTDKEFAGYFKMVRESASIVFDEIQSAVDFLKRFSMNDI